MLILAAPPAKAIAPRPAPSAALVRKPADFYQTDKIWTIHLTFTPDQWKAMEPKQSDQRGFGPGMFLAPSFLKAGDANQDKKLAGPEFHALAERWFDQWDAKKAGALGLDELKDGLNDSIELPQFGGPGGALQAGEGKRNGVAAMAGIEYEYVHARVDIGGKVFADAGVRYKGNGTFLESQRDLKRPIKINIDKYDDKQNLAGITVFNLHNCVTDNSWMNDVLGHRLFRDAGVPSPRTAYAKVYVTVPGLHQKRYFGLYEVVEEVGKSFARDNFGDDSGAIFKPVTPKLFEYLGEDWKKYVQTYDPKTKLTDAQKARLLEFCRIVSQADDATLEARFGEFVDVDKFVRYLAALVYMSEIDGLLGPGQNLYLYLHPKTNKFIFIPWDLDHSFGHFNMRGTQTQREQLSLDKPWQGPNPFLGRVFKIPAVKQAYLSYVRKFSTTLFQPARFVAQVDALTPVLRPAIAAESPQKLARFDQLVAGKTLPEESPFGGGQSEPFKPIKVFTPIRTRSVVDQLAGRTKGADMGDLNIFGPQPGPDGKPQKFGAGNFLNQPLMMMLDRNGNKALDKAELVTGFDGWFGQWSGGAESLDEGALRKAIDKMFSGPPPGGGPGGPPSGGPPGGDPAAMVGPIAVQLTGAGEKPTLAAFAAGWKKRAAEWDKDRDGKLTRQELSEGVSAVVGGPFPVGNILGPQLLKAMKAEDSVSVAKFAETFAAWGKVWDANKDGALDKTEMARGIMKSLPPPDFGPGGPGGGG